MRQIFVLTDLMFAIGLQKSENINLMLYWSLGIIFDKMSSKDSLNNKVGWWINSFKGMKDVEEKRCSESYWILYPVQESHDPVLCKYGCIRMRKNMGIAFFICFFLALGYFIFNSMDEFCHMALDLVK